jgi:hypothetical protein
VTEPTILCPQCKAQVKLTESLAAPLVEATRREYERRMAQMNLECAKREEALKQQEQALARAKTEWKAAEQERFRVERERIAEEEARRAELRCQTDLAQRQGEIVNLQAILKARDQKLADAQKAQAQYVQKERALEDQRRELDLTVQRRVTEGLSAVRSQVRAEVEETLKLKVLEKEQTISSMQKQIDVLKRKAEQGSQQLQGEVQELELEALLGSKFPLDSILPVRKGEGGGDVLQRVSGGPGQSCGAILWETKRTKNWSDSWLPKLREDQRNSKADLAVIVSHALPKDVESFEWVDGVWVTHPRLMIPLATVLRQGLVEVEAARKASEGQQTKAEMVYQYLAGPRFRQRIQAIVEAFTCMQEDLEKEKRATLRLWAKRDEQISRVMHSTVGMYGDLQGIAGKSIGEIEGLEADGFELRLGSADLFRSTAPTV